MSHIAFPSFVIVLVCDAMFGNYGMKNVGWCEHVTVVLDGVWPFTVYGIGLEGVVMQGGLFKKTNKITRGGKYFAWKLELKGVLMSENK